MALTQKQEWLITQFERTLFAGLGEIPESSRKRVQARLRGEILKRLNRYASSIDDFTVQEVLASFGDPVAVGTAMLNAEKHVANPVPKSHIPQGSVFTISTEDSRWLGVCGGMARYFSLDVRMVRTAVIVFGLLSGPVALLLYLAVYFQMYFSAEYDEVPVIKYTALLKTLGIAVFCLVGLHVVARMLIWGISVGFAQLTTKTAPLNLNGLEWLVLNNGYALFWAAFTTLPFATLAGLPMTNRWEDTMQRLTYACLVLYAVGLCLGIGAFIAGLILAGTGTRLVQ